MRNNGTPIYNIKDQVVGEIRWCYPDQVPDGAVEIETIPTTAGLRLYAIPSEALEDN